MLMLCVLMGGEEARAEMTPDASVAFDHYAAMVEAELARDQPFLRLEKDPEDKRQVLGGAIVIVPREVLEHGEPVEAPKATIEDWQGDVFLPGVTLGQVERSLAEYGKYPEYYKPDVLQAKLLWEKGGDRRVYLRLYRKQVVTVVLDTEYAVHSENPAPGQMRMSSRSVRIQEVKRGAPAFSGPAMDGDSYGFLWRLNSYWKFQETPKGVIAECRAVSLSRDIPFGLGWVLRDFIRRFPRDSMERTLEGTRRGALGR